MGSPKKKQEKARLHPRNKNRERYDLTALTQALPELANYITTNKYGNDSVDFTNPIAVKMLNKAILYHYYDIQYWEFPDKNLCPPIPGRADYIHHMADLLAEHNAGIPPTGDRISCLDIGVGANCIYPIIGVTQYQWRFIGTDIDSKSIASAKQIALQNDALKTKVSCRLQTNSKQLFKGIIAPEEKIDLSICNPPFHATKSIAEEGTRRKIKNLSGKEQKTPTLNFAGVHNELICEGGEYAFIRRMIKQSADFSKNCYWFSTLVSKKEHLKGIYKSLKSIGVNQIKTIPMGTGNKSSRVVAWTFLTQKEQLDWSTQRWPKK